MDPYVNTAGIKIAIVNEDSGADNEKLSLNAGNTIASNLKENDKLGWTFVARQEAIKGVKSGEYYAAIIIPEDFSSSLLSVLSGKIEAPQLDYYINEKKNAIAPKFTDTGATTVQQEINDTFSSVAAQTISEIVQGSAKDLTGDVNQLNIKMDSNLAEVKKNIAQYQKVLKNFQNTTEQSSSLINDTVKTLDEVKLQQIPEIKHYRILPLFCKKADRMQEIFPVHLVRIFQMGKQSLETFINRFQNN